MKKIASKIRPWKAAFAALFTVILFLNGVVLNAQPFKVLAVSDMVRVFEDGYNPPPSSDTVKIFGIRSEILSGQFTIHAKNNLTGVTIEPGVLKNHKTGSTISPEWNFVGTIPLTENTPGYEVPGITRKAPAQFPDYLTQEKQVNVSKNTWINECERSNYQHDPFIKPCSLYKTSLNSCGEEDYTNNSGDHC